MSLNPTARPQRSLQHVVYDALRALNYLQQDVAELLGISVRTVQRRSNWGFVSSADYELLLRALQPTNPALAAELAQATGHDLAALGLVPRPPPPRVEPPLPPARLEHAEAVVCAAADAMNVVPRDARPVVAAIFERALALGVDHAALARLLAPPQRPAATKREAGAKAEK